MKRKFKNTEKSQIMKYAYELYRASNNQKSWSNCLKMSWKQAKSFPTFNRFVEQAKNRYFTYILIRLNNNTFDAEECFSDCIYKVHRVFHTIDVTKNIFTYFYKVINTTVVDYYRKRTNNTNEFNSSVVSYDKQYGDENDDLTNTIGDVIGADINIERKELADIIESAKNTLSNVQKDVIDMVIFQGYKYKEVANMLNIPINTVKVQVLRGRHKMMEHITAKTNGIVPV